MGEAAGATSMQQLHHHQDFYGQQFLHGDTGLPDLAGDSSSVGLMSSLAGPSTSASMAQDTTDSSGQPAILRKSCQHCRKRKIKCMPSETDSSTCKACSNKGQQCIFEKQATMGRPPKSKKKGSDDDSTTSPQDHSASLGGSAKKKQPISRPKTDPQQPKLKKQKANTKASQNAATADQAHQYSHFPTLDNHFVNPPLSATSASDSPSSAHLPTLPPYAWNTAQSTIPSYSWNANFQLPLPNLPNYSQYPYPSSFQGYPQAPQSDSRLDAYSYPSASAPSSSSAHQTSFSPIRPPFSFFPHQQPVPPSIAQQAPLHADPASATTESRKPSNASLAASQAGPSITNNRSVSPPDSSSTSTKSTRTTKLAAALGPAATTSVQRIQRSGDLYDAFKTQPLLSVVNAFFESYSAAPAPRSSPPPASLSDPGVAPIAKMRTLYGTAVSARKPIPKAGGQASADYARSIIAPLWDGIPVDIVSLVTTGRPSASGPFALGGGPSPSSSAGGGATSQVEDFLFSKLLREDESNSFAVSHYINPKDKQSPYLKFAPSKAAVGKYFHGYFSKHPLAPLIVNEKIFVDDLANDKADDMLVNVIIGSAIARGPCLGGGADARDIGEYFYNYIQNSLLARTTADCLKLETCQAIMLWAAHEMAHMRQRRACALWNTADVLLRERNKRYQIAAEKRKNSDFGSGTAISWRGLVEQELTVNSMWVLNIIHTWAAISLKLPHTAMSVFTSSLSTPPKDAAASVSFQYAYSQENTTMPLPSQHIVRRVINRFADVTHLLGVIVAIKNQQQVRGLLAPDPPRPMAIANEGNDSQVAAWLLELAHQYKSPSSESSNQLVTQSSTAAMSESCRAFLPVSHAILALYQLLPFAPPSVTEVGVPVPMPTIDSLKTALRALHLLSTSITSSSPNTRSRTQALLLDAMPRVISLLDLFTSTALDSLDHFILVTSHRDMIGELLRELSLACMALESSSPNADGRRAAARQSFERARNGLQNIAQLGTDLQESKSESHDDLAMQWSHHEDLGFTSEPKLVAPEYHHGSATNTGTGSSGSSTPAELYLAAAMSNPGEFYNSNNTSFQYISGNASNPPPDASTQSPAESKPTSLPSSEQSGAHDLHHYAFHNNTNDLFSFT